MRLTRGADYGVRGVARLAAHPSGSTVLVGEIAHREGIPESYLAKIFQTLAKSGILESHRGSGGGFSLARSASEISLREVIEAIEGKVSLVACLDGQNTCSRADTCALRPVLAAAQEQLLAALQGSFVSDLALSAGSGLSESS